MKKAIVTGGAGFIGSHITEELVKRGYKVTIFDNLSTGKLSNIESSLNGKDVELVKGSIVDLPLLRKVFSALTMFSTRQPFPVSPAASIIQKNPTMPMSPALLMCFWPPAIKA